MGLLAKLGRGVCRNAIACFYKRINESDMKIYHFRNGLLYQKHLESFLRECPVSEFFDLLLPHARSLRNGYYVSEKTKDLLDVEQASWKKAPTARPLGRARGKILNRLLAYRLVRAFNAWPKFLAPMTVIPGMGFLGTFRSGTMA